MYHIVRILDENSRDRVLDSRVERILPGGRLVDWRICRASFKVDSRIDGTYWLVWLARSTYICKRWPIGILNDCN